MRALLLSLLLLLQAVVFAQPAGQQTVRANIDAYGNNNPQERVYIQFDKPAYLPGETVWFKAYFMKGFEISALSKTFYADFIDADGKILLHGVYPVWDASAAGSFTIDSTYAGTSIRIRAYTKWMLNFDSAFLYSKDIRVVTKAALQGSGTKRQAPQCFVQFFAEGGDCIAGIKTKIAFKANYQNGLPADISGVVTDGKGNVTDSIQTQHDGMGFFYVEAQPGESYTAKWVDGYGTPHQTPLPAIKVGGATLSLTLGKQRVGYVVKRSDDVPDELKQLHIVATLQQQVVYMAPVSLDASPITGGNIPTGQLLSGVLQVTLFNANWKPVAERICFINNHDFSFEPRVNVDTAGTGKRQKNVVVVDMPDTMESNMSVSVTDAGLGTDSSDDIISHLLLTGDLKGKVYHPGFYFYNNSDSAAKYLDLVMLTNGWRRYKWDDVVANRSPALKYPRDTAYLNFSGQIFGASPKQLKDAGGIITIVSPRGKDSLKQIITMAIASDGSFSKPGYIFFDTLKVYYQFLSKAGAGLNSSAEVAFSPARMPAPAGFVPDKTSLSLSFWDTTGNYRSSIIAQQQARLLELLKTTTLKGVTVTTRAKTRMEVMDEKYTGGLFSGGNPAAQFDVANDPLAPGSPDVFSYLTGRVAGLTINNSGTPQVSIVYRGTPVSVYVDEVPMDLSSASNLNMNDIAYVKVMGMTFLGGMGLTGSSAGAGTIAIYTRKGDDAANTPRSSGMQYKLVAGYTPLKEFYSPDYADASQVYGQEDLRTTLYWNPLLLTSAKNHMLRLQFYNNDVTSRYRIILEGVSRDGKFTRVEKLVE